MSSWADITIGGMSISATQNYYTKWYFRKAERVHEEVARKDSEEVEEIYRFQSTAATIKQRLELDGFTRAALEREFCEQLQHIVIDLGVMAEIDENVIWNNHLNVVKNSTLDEWVIRLERIWKEGLKSKLDTPCPSTGDPLLDFMLSTQDFFSQRPGAGGYNFPCFSVEAYAIALLEFMPDETPCMLDITELVEGGWTNDFDDLVEYQGENTIFYEVFVEALTEIHQLKDLAPDNTSLTRLLYASVITAMETYLSDTLKKQVLNREAIRRRFIKAHDAFKVKIVVADIYEKMESLKTEIVSEIDKMSFHNLDRIPALYRSVLTTEFPDGCLADLKRALDLRHDIVHRNGKSIAGTVVDISVSDVNGLIELVDRTIYCIDKQIKDRLLDELDE